MQMRFLTFTLLVVAGLSFSRPSGAQDAQVHNRPTENTFTNPILPGGFPDPSICRDGDWWYVVNSSFEYYPGLPIHRSRDLVNWELIGYGLHRPEQVTGAVNLVDVQSNGGIHAPSLRCRDGQFLIITTNVYQPVDPELTTQFVNFVITAENPAGPWSNPHVIAGAPGIDPDLFLDDDGRTWYVGNHAPEEPNFPGEGEIWLQEVDTRQWKLIGNRHFLWRGACRGTWAEGPHIYKRDGRYYLLIAEGGTHFDHAVMVAAADSVTGPYQSNPRNPILTSRHLSYDYWVNSTGHGDLFELADGRWYMVALGIRNELARASNMGRETFLVPVRWEREPYEWKEVKLEWPVVAPETGRVERINPVIFPGTRQHQLQAFRDDFDDDTLGLQWNFRRLPVANTLSLTNAPGHLRLAARPEVISERRRASLLGIRQTESDFDYRTRMRFDAKLQDSEAGISLFQKDDNHVNLTVAATDAGTTIRLVVTVPTQPPRTVIEAPLTAYPGDVELWMASFDGQLRLGYRLADHDTDIELAILPAGLVRSRGYTGAYLGLYASTNGQEAEAFADFDWVEYLPHGRD